MIKIIFVMYNHETDGVKVSLDDKIHVSFNCQKCNASVHLDEPSDIAYLIRLAREEPGLYAKLASRDGGLQVPVIFSNQQFVFSKKLLHPFLLPFRVFTILIISRPQK